MFEAVQAAIRHANAELEKANVRGSVVIELDRNDWTHFKQNIPLSAAMPAFDRTDGNAESCVLNGGVVRVKRQGPDVEGALLAFMSSRCRVSSQHKLPTRDEINATELASLFRGRAFDVALARLIDVGKIIEYGPYLSDHEIDVL